MSMMGGTEQVGLDFSVSGNYGASLTQMIQQADAYARSADTMIGKVAGLNVVTTALISKTTALTGANRVATAEAAAYQQKLAALAPMAVVAGQSFDRLSSQTLALGRQFGSMDAAVVTMRTLQQSGLSAADSVGTLAKQFMQLDAAHGGFGGQIGSEMLMLGRSFGNATGLLGKFGDSLTSLSAKYGASAQGTLQFANALAPVASSVGVSETAVLGLGAAASRLGQDGYAGANAFNKVLLDMSSSIRNGNPQIKEYANLLNMSTSALSQMFKNDPTEVVLRFTEAIGRGGANAQRSLEALGFDAVRTTRAITALSSQGNLRQIIGDASSQYGSGSTQKAAEASLDTVNHKFAQLQETLSQTVAGAGKPFLGFLGGVADAANTAASAVNSLVNSDALQKLGTIAAPLGFIGSAAISAGSALSTVALGRQAINFVGAKSGFTEGRSLVRQGIAEGMSPEDARSVLAGTNPLMQLGGLVGAGNPTGATGTARVRGLLGGGLRAGTNIFAGAENMVANQFAGADWRSRGVSFESTQQYATTATALRKSALKGIAEDVRADPGVASISEGAKKAGQVLIDFAHTGSQAEGSWRAALAGAGRVGTAAGGYALREGGRALGAARSVGSAGFGMLADVTGIGALAGPVGWGIAGAATAGFAVKQYNDDQSRIREEGHQAQHDIYGAYNDFAAAAGLAGKGAQSLAEALQQSTKQILDANQTLGQALNPGSDVVRNALNPSYQRAFTSVSSTDPQLAALQARLMLGASPTVGATGRVVSDLYNQGGAGFGKSAAGSLQDMLKGNTDLTSSWLTNIGKTSSWVLGRPTDDTATLTNSLVGNIGDQANQIGKVYGNQAAYLSQLQQGSKLFSQATDLAASGKLTNTAQGQVADVLSQITGVSSDVFDSALRKNLQSLRDKGTKQDLSSILPGLVNSQSVNGDADRAKLQALIGLGNFSNPNFSQFFSTPVQQQQGFALEGSMQPFGKVKTQADSLATALYGAQMAAAHFGTTVDKVSTDQINRFTGGGTAAGQATPAAILAQFVANPDNAALKGAAGNSLANVALRGAGGNSALAQLQIALQMGNTSEGTPERLALTEASNATQRQQIVTAGGLGMMGSTGQAIKAAQYAQAVGPQTDQNAEAARQQALAAGAQALSQRQDFMKQFVEADQQMNISIGRQDEDAARSRMRSNRDFNTQMLQSQQDYAKSRMRAERDFNISLKRMAEDAAKSVYDPYTKMEAQRVVDANSLIQNMAAQTAAMNAQVANVARLRKMGLSQQAVDTLSLSQSQNGQEVQDLLNNAQGDPTVIARLNAAARAQGAAAKNFTQNSNNVDYRRAVQDFRKSMADASVDFATQMGRATLAHKRALSDMAVDLGVSEHRAQEDLVRMGHEVTGSFTDIQAQFLSAVAALPQDKGLKDAMSKNITLMIGAAATSANSAMDALLKPLGLTNAQLQALINQANGINTTGQGQSTQPRGGGGGTSTMGSLPRSSAGAVSAAYADINSLTLPPNECDHFVGLAYGLAHTNYDNARQHWMQIPDGFKYPGASNAPAGALVFWNTGKDGHVALSVGGGKVISTDFRRQGHVDLVAIDEITKRWGQIYGWSDPYFHGATAPLGPTGANKGGRQLMAGGVAMTRLDNATLGEAGHEVVLPLNEHGAKVLTETMARYADSVSVRQARVAPFSTPTANYFYDQRTMITGPVTVEASDPASMFRALEAQKKLDRMRQPVGSTNG